MEEQGGSEFHLVTDESSQLSGRTTTREAVFNTWNAFAKKNNILLATFCNLNARADTIMRNGGACPCKPKERPVCPCPEAIQECQEKGECFCRVFLAQDWQERWRERLHE